MGTTMIASISQKLVNGVGFSNGWALFTLYQPPPLVKSCLMASKAATPPRGMGCVSTLASTITGTLVMMTAPFVSFCGTSTVTATPLAMTGWPFSSILGWETVTATLVVMLFPLSSVFCTWVVYGSMSWAV